MHEDYCFKCGVWARIDEASKLCRPCYDAWPYARRPETSGARGWARPPGGGPEGDAQKPVMLV